MASCIQTAPFPYFGGKRTIAETIWRAFGTPQQYIEPFCGSAAVLLAAPAPASLEVIGDLNGFIANFWRSVKHDPRAVALAADYPVSHIDLGARHVWLMAQRDRLGSELSDPNWPGDSKVAGWWLWGQCCWIGSGWCDWLAPSAERRGKGRAGSDPLGQIPHASDAGRGVQALGKVPHASDAGMGQLWTSGGRTAWRWLHGLADRLERVRVVHGSWDRCLNNHYGAEDTAVFLDPPYSGREEVYGGSGQGISGQVRQWALDNSANRRIALCGLVGEHEMPDWTCHQWSRGKYTYSGSATTDEECIWFSPSCAPISAQLSLLEGA